MKLEEEVDKKPIKNRFKILQEKIQKDKDILTLPSNMVETLSNSAFPLIPIDLKKYRDRRDRYLPYPVKENLNTMDTSQQIVSKINDFNHDLKQVTQHIKDEKENSFSYTKNISTIRSFTKERKNKDRPMEVFSNIINNYDYSKIKIDDDFFDIDVFVDSPLLIQNSNKLFQYFEMKAILNGNKAYDIDKYDYFLFGLKKNLHYAKLLKRKKNGENVQMNSYDYSNSENIIINRFKNKFLNRQIKEHIKKFKHIKVINSSIKKLNYPKNLKKKKYSLIKDNLSPNTRSDISLKNNTNSNIVNDNTKTESKLSPIKKSLSSNSKNLNQSVLKSFTPSKNIKLDSFIKLLNNNPSLFNKNKSFIIPKDFFLNNKLNKDLNASVANKNLANNSNRGNNNTKKNSPEKNIPEKKIESSNIVIKGFENTQNIYEQLKHLSVSTKNGSKKADTLLRKYYNSDKELFNYKSAPKHLQNLYSKFPEKIGNMYSYSKRLPKLYGNPKKIPESINNIISSNSTLNKSLSDLSIKYCFDYIKNVYIDKKEN